MGSAFSQLQFKFGRRAPAAKFTYPALPRACRYNHHAYMVIADDRHIICWHRSLAATPPPLRMDYLLVYSRYRNTWSDSIRLELDRDRDFEPNVTLLGFVGPRSIQAMITNDNSAEIVTIGLSRTFDDAWIVSRNLLYTAGCTFLAVFRPHQPLLLLSQNRSTNVLSLYEVKDTTIDLIRSIGLNDTCGYATQLDRQLHLVCQTNFGLPVFLKCYDLDTGRLDDVVEYDALARGITERPEHYPFHTALGNVLITYAEERKLMIAFDLTTRSAKAGLAKRKVAPYHVELLPSGEALMFMLLGETEPSLPILNCWFKPPSLAELALRCVHANMPVESREKLRSSSVDDIAAFMEFCFS